MKPAKKRERRSTGRRARIRQLSDNELAEIIGRFEAKRAKIEAFELLSLVKPSGAALSHIAEENLKDYKEAIYRAANENRREFFIELGKLLEGTRLKPNRWSKRDQDIAFILCLHPKITTTEAVHLLKELGHPVMSLEAFKQLKYNWKRAAAKTRQRLEKSGWKYLGNSFLDGSTP